MDKKATVRDFRRGDEAEAAALLKMGKPSGLGDPADLVPADLATDFPSETSDLLVATLGKGDDERVVGLVALTHQADGLGRLIHLVVAREHRGVGVGRSMLSALAERVRARNLHAIQVDMPISSNEAIVVCERLGLSAKLADPNGTTLWIDLIWTTDQIETERLILKAPLASDNAFVVELLTDPATRTYLGGPASFAITEWIKSHSLAPQWGTFIVWQNDSYQRVGMIELDTWRGELELSCHFLPEFWGIGYATESVAAALEWAWSYTDEPAVISVVQPANASALRTLAGVGFVQETVFEEDGEDQTLLRLPRPGISGGEPTVESSGG